jgi:hypothetical protein
VTRTEFICKVKIKGKYSCFQHFSNLVSFPFPTSQAKNKNNIKAGGRKRLRPVHPPKHLYEAHAARSVVKAMRGSREESKIVSFHHRFFAAPMCVPWTLLPKSRLLLLSCQCAASGDRCSIMSVRLDLPLAAVPPRED